MFIVFALLQFNDPDPEVWATTYFFIAGICFWNAFRKVPFYISLFFIGGTLIWAFFQWPVSYNGITGAMTPGSGIEEARESLGLLICSAACLFVFLSSRKLEQIRKNH